MLEVGSDPRPDDGRRMADLRAVPNTALVTWRTPTQEPSPSVGRRVLDNRTGAPWRDLPEGLATGIRSGDSSDAGACRVCGTSCCRPWQTAAASGYAADDRQHHGPGASLCSRRKSGIHDPALGRSRGGFTTKMHLRCNAHGLPIGVVLSEGQAHDVTAYEELMEQRDSDPGVMLADKGYDSDSVRQDCAIAAPRPRSRPSATARCSSGQRAALCGACTHRMLHRTSQGTAAHCHPI